MGNYEHANQQIRNIDREIKMDNNGKGYSELTKEEKNRVILDYFFHGQSGRYGMSADKLRAGMEAYENDEITNDDKIVKIRNSRGTGTHYQIRHINGRFGRWVK
jgi:hypothetical protein